MSCFDDESYLDELDLNLVKMCLRKLQDNRQRLSYEAWRAKATATEPQAPRRVKKPALVTAFSIDDYVTQGSCTMI